MLPSCGEISVVGYWVFLVEWWVVGLCGVWLTDLVVGGLVRCALADGAEVDVVDLYVMECQKSIRRAPPQSKHTPAHVCLYLDVLVHHELAAQVVHAEEHVQEDALGLRHAPGLLGGRARHDIVVEAAAVAELQDHDIGVLTCVRVCEE